MQSSVESRMGDLGNRIKETRDVDMIVRVPPGVIQAINNTIMDKAPSGAMELLNQRIDDLTQISYTDQVNSADLRFLQVTRES